MSDSTLLEVTGLTAGYVRGLDILTDVNLTVKQNEIVGISGPTALASPRS